MDFRPFRGLRPRPDVTAQVACPPYDVISSEEARERVVGNPLSLLHVTKPEVDLAPGVDPYSDIVYATAAFNFHALIDQGVLLRDDTPGYYVYRQTMGAHVQTGIVGVAAVDDYDRGLIKKHEHTRRDKEDDRARHVDSVGANAGPVFLTCRADAVLDALADEVTDAEPIADILAEGVRHTLWVVRDVDRTKAMMQAFQATPAFYVADGHHRAASASRTRALRRDRNPRHTGDEAYNRFLAVVFPHDQLQILPYNRVLRDLNGMSPEQLVERLRESFDVEPAADASPSEPRTFRLYLERRWWALRAKPGTWPEGDAVRSLDVAILQHNVLEPLFGIGDPRTDKRIDFVGGIRGTAELERLVDGGSAAAAFAMFPTTVEQLMSVADSGEVMPPKSTWFEPKLRSGLVIHVLDGDGPAIPA